MEGDASVDKSQMGMIQMWCYYWWGAGCCLCLLHRVGKLLKGCSDLLSFTWSKEKPMLGELVSRMGLLGA